MVDLYWGGHASARQQIRVNSGEIQVAGGDITTAEKAAIAINDVDAALDSVNSARAELGAVINRMTSITDNLSNVSQNLSESRSRILDADYAKGTAELARTQIIRQAAMAVLSQANAQPQMVLKLLQG